MIIFSNLWSCWFWLTIYFIALLGCTCIVRFRFHHEESLFPPSHLPQYITIQPTVLFIVLSHLGCRKAHPPHGWSSGWLQHPGNKNIWSAANIFYISSANVDPSGCARNWKIGSTPQLCGWPPGWWLTSALPGPGQSKWSQFTQDLHHCKYLNIKWGGELNNYT